MRSALHVLVAAQLFAFAGGVAHAQSAKEGEVLFRQRCTMCHTTKSGGAPGIGPNLAGVGGRKAGSASYKYTAAMKNSGLTWKREQLDKLLVNPSKLVPGSTMNVAVPDAKQRAAIVAYLLSLKR